MEEGYKISDAAQEKGKASDVGSAKKEKSFPHTFISKK
jgi:hypothetical protein